MLSIKSLLPLCLCLILLTANRCPKEADESTLAKIAFDYTAIDDKGLRGGTVAVDYEFCIPAGDDSLEEVLKIDSAVRVMQKSKGRIGCTEDQWLCINSTHSDGWKEKLYKIASLDYVKRIQETVYE